MFGVPYLGNQAFSGKYLSDIKMLWSMGYTTVLTARSNYLIWPRKKLSNLRKKSKKGKQLFFDFLSMRSTTA